MSPAYSRRPESGAKISRGQPTMRVDRAGAAERLKLTKYLDPNKLIQPAERALMKVFTSLYRCSLSILMQAIDLNAERRVFEVVDRQDRGA